MSIMNLLESILFPSSLLNGFILAIFFTTITLYILWKIYEKNYQFTRKEKITTFLLSFLFMVVGVVAINHYIPIIVWALLAFQFTTDRKYMELPDGVNLTIALFSIFSIIHNWGDYGFLQSGIVTGIILFLFFLLLSFLGQMGGGDIKMMGAIGLYFTLWEIPALLVYCFLIGAIHGIGIMIAERKVEDVVFAFGPALILGVLTTAWLQGGMAHV